MYLTFEMNIFTTFKFMNNIFISLFFLDLRTVLDYDHTNGNIYDDNEILNNLKYKFDYHRRAA